VVEEEVSSTCWSLLYRRLSFWVSLYTRVFDHVLESRLEHLPHLRGGMFCEVCGSVVGVRQWLQWSCDRVRVEGAWMAW
jgi:hypothetical protein